MSPKNVKKISIQIVQIYKFYEQDEFYLNCIWKISKMENVRATVFPKNTKKTKNKHFQPIFTFSYDCQLNLKDFDENLQIFHKFEKVSLFFVELSFISPINQNSFLLFYLFIKKNLNICFFSISLLSINLNIYL